MCCAINNKAHLWNGLIKNQYGGQKAKLDSNCDIVDIIGPDVLTLTVGSDIARGPNAPRPACRGYLHKRTQSGLIKGWRKRWFVLTHDCCLYYYRHKRVSMIQVIKIKQSTKKFLCTFGATSWSLQDEGKRQALSAIKMEGAEVGPDTSLGKPFVFKCHPQSGFRVYFFCATSNQEMKR